MYVYKVFTYINFKLCTLPLIKLPSYIATYICILIYMYLHMVQTGVKFNAKHV